MAASNAVIGALRVVLGADTVAFDKGLKDAEKSLAHFQAAMGKIAVGLGVGAAAAAIAFGTSLKHALDQADKLGKLSQSLGIPVEQLSALKHAADLSGVSIEEVGKSVSRLSRSMSEIAGGKEGGGAQQAFKALGISVTDAGGKLKSANTIMEEVADRFAKMQDGAGKTALAVSIFGRSGANMIPMLNQGSAALKEAREEAEQLGLVIDLRTAKAAEAFNDNLTRLQRVMGGVAIKVAAELAPMLSLLTMRMVEYAKTNNVAQTTADKIIGTFETIGRAASTVSHFVHGLTSELKLLGDVVVAFFTKSPAEFAEAWKRFREEGEKNESGLEDIRVRFQNLREEARMLADHMGNTGAQFGKLAPPVLTAKNALDEFFKSQAKAIATQQADAAAIGLSAGARERLRLVMQAETIARENNIKMTDAQRIKVTELANAMQMAVLQQQGMNLLLEAAEPHEKFRLEMANNIAALQAIGATGEQVGAVMKMTAEKFGATWEQVMSGAAGNFAALATEVAKKNSALVGVAKALAIVEATINTYVGFTKALASVPPPLNYIAAAGVLAAGMAKVIAIKSQSVPKMATGGSLTPRAFPGQDSTLLQARVRPDEQIDIWRPGEGPDPRRGAGGTTIVQMQLPAGAAGRFVEELINDINSKISDGYRLKVA